MKSLRLFILGDPHVNPHELSLWEEIVSDINKVAPDLVLIVGDLTGSPWMGTTEGLNQAVGVFSKLHAPWYSVIGNHDLQAPEFPRDEAAVGAFLKAVKRPHPWFSLDVGPLTIIGLSNTRFRNNGNHPNEIVLEPEQLKWWAEELTAKADRPVLVLCHTPPIGSAVLTLTELHCRSNAIVNQNRQPGEVLKILLEHANILFWFSGHNHMGQHYRDAISCRAGVHFVHTAVASRQVTRDGFRQSRLLEIRDDGFLIRTYDHTLRAFDDTLDYRDSSPLDEWLDYRRSIKGRAIVPMNPETMRQGPDKRSRKPDVYRIGFTGEEPTPQSFDGWIRRSLGYQVDCLVVAGFLPPPAANLSRVTIIYLSDREGISTAYAPTNPKPLPPNLILLSATRPDELIQEIASHPFSTDQNLVVACRLSPEILPESKFDMLKNGPQKIWWLCSEGSSRSWPWLEIISTKGMVIADWDGKALHLAASLEGPSAPRPYRQSLPTD